MATPPKNPRRSLRQVEVELNPPPREKSPSKVTPKVESPPQNPPGQGNLNLPRGCPMGTVTSSTTMATMIEIQVSSKYSSMSWTTTIVCLDEQEPTAVEAVLGELRKISGWLDSQVLWKLIQIWNVLNCLLIGGKHPVLEERMECENEAERQKRCRP